jgi:hypothetical protein
MTVTSGASATLEEDRLAVDDEPAAGTGRALRNLAPNRLHEENAIYEIAENTDL